MKKNKPVTLENIEFSLYELKNASNDLVRFTEKLTLLKMMDKTAVKVNQAVDNLQKLLRRGLSVDELVDAFDTSPALLTLDEMVDADILSDLETHLLSFANEVNDPKLSLFLGEIIDKIEEKYTVLLNKTHNFNALIRYEYDD